MATADENRTIAPIVGPDDPRQFTDSGIDIQPLYTEADVADDLTAKESNERYRYLLRNGSTGLSMAFDLPTQLGLDSDDPRCLGEVGRTGVAIDSIDDMRTVFDQIPLDQVSTSMTINAPAAVLLLLYELVGEEQGVPSRQLRGTTQNDILKEYIARGNFIYPPEGAIRLTTDLFAYCDEHVPKWNTISISGYHFREKGCSGSPTSRRRSMPAWRSTISARGWRSSSTATTTSSRRWPSSGPPGGCGRRSCATGSGPRTSVRGACASTPRPVG